jgi:translocation and assembly module TamB
MTRVVLKRLLSYFTIAIMLILLLLMAVGYYLLFTHDGSRYSLSVIQRLLPGDLQVESIHGRLAGPLELKGLTYQQHDGLGFRSERIYLDWRPVQLLKMHLRVSEFSLKEIALQLPPGERSDDKKTSEPFQGVKLPLAVTLSDISCDGFELDQGEGVDPVRIDELNLSANTKGKRLWIRQFEAAAYSTQLSLRGRLDLDERLPMSFELSWEHTLEAGTHLAGEGELSGDLQLIELTQQLAHPFEGLLQGQLSDLLGNPEWEAELSLTQAVLGDIIPAFPARVAGKLQAQGSFDRADIETDLQLAESRIGEITAVLRGNYNQGALRIPEFHISNAQGLDLKGEGEYHPQREALSAEVAWRGLRWPLNGKSVDISSKSGRLHLQGGFDAYEYRLTMQAFRAEVGAMQLDAVGKGSLQQVDLDKLSFELEQGRIAGSGRLTWQPKLTWEMGLTGEGVNPALFHPMFPGDLAFNLDTQGEFAQKGARGEFNLNRLIGSLREYPLEGKGRVSLAHDHLKVHALELVTASNRIAIDGELGDFIDMNWSVDAPELAPFWPGLSGSLSAKGDLGGTLQAPSITADLTVNGLNLGGYGIGRLDGDLALEMANEQPLKLLLHSEQLSGFGKQWESLDIDIDGRVTQHSLKVDLVGEQAPQLSLRGVSGFDKENRLRGALQRLLISTPEIGEWSLESVLSYRLATNRIDIEKSCLVSGEARLCAGFHQQADDWRAGLQALQLPLPLLQPFLPPETQIVGMAELEAEFSAVAGGALEGDAQLRIPRGELGFTLGDAQQQLDFSSSKANLLINKKGLNADLNFPLQQLGGFVANVRLPGFDPANPQPTQQTLQGKIKGEIGDLAMLAAISPRLQNSRGDFTVDMTVAGKLGEPFLNGEAMLSGGAVDIPVLGIELRDIEMNMKAPDLQTLSLDGRVRSGEGTLSFGGSMRMDAGKGFPSEFSLEGEKWLAVNVPEAEVAISPKLRFQQRANKSLLEGEVHVPYARIRPRALPETAVSGSSDLVIVGGGAETDQTQMQADTPLHAKIRLSLGERVSFDGFGLRGRFTGGLMVIDEPGRPVFGRGRLGITDGVYQAYGQDLKIERGYALFADSPVDNPGLDVRAVREIEDVTAGMRISGTMKKPKLKLFSTPTMPETDILSYIVTGRPGGESSGKTAGMLAMLQASGAGSVASELGRQLGLEELRVDTGGSLEEASLVAGTYLSPRLYVQYVNELATSETKIRMRYDLTDRWQLEAETGRTQSGDFFYTFDR